MSGAEVSLTDTTRMSGIYRRTKKRTAAGFDCAACTANRVDPDTQAAEANSSD